jgi:hypothetical protein
MKKINKKLQTILCISFLIISSFIYKPFTAIAIVNFWTEVAPASINSRAEYQFHFDLQHKLYKNNWVQIIFPKDTTINPPLPNNQTDRDKRFEEMTKFITFNNQSQNKQGTNLNIENNSDGNFVLTINSPFSIDPSLKEYKETVLTISKKAGFVNPSKPNAYTYKIRTYHELSYHCITSVVIIDEEKTNKISINLQIDNSISFVNGKIQEPMEVAPYIEKNRTIVPLKFIAEKFDLSISYDQDYHDITISNRYKAIVIMIDYKTALYNGKTKDLEIVPKIKNNRTMIYLMFFKEVFDAKINYDGKTKNITIEYYVP